MGHWTETFLNMQLCSCVLKCLPLHLTVVQEQFFLFNFFVLSRYLLWRKPRMLHSCPGPVAHESFQATSRLNWSKEAVGHYEHPCSSGESTKIPWWGMLRNHLRSNDDSMICFVRQVWITDWLYKSVNQPLARKDLFTFRTTWPSVNLWGGRFDKRPLIPDISMAAASAATIFGRLHPTWEESVCYLNQKDPWEDKSSLWYGSHDSRNAKRLLISA